MIKKGLKENMTDFLQTPNKLSNKKRKQISKSKQKANIRETTSRKATFSSLDNSDKKEILVPIVATKISKSKVKDIDNAMIGGDAYCAIYCLKKGQVFAISMRDIQYQDDKKARAKTYSKSVICQEYHDFLDIFLKKNSDILSPYQKYDHKIHLKEEQKPSHAPLYKISPKKLDVVK